MELTKIPAYQLTNMLKKKEITALQITQDFLQKVQENKDLNAYITITEELSLKQAKETDNRLKEGKTLSKLDGIPVAIKDNFLTKGIRTTNASKFFANFVPPYESTITSKLYDAGMVFMGKTNMDEFAMGSDNTTSYFGAVINSWRCKDNLNKVPGGSSGGSAVAVAANTVPLSLGTDTGGSVRQPAAFCGVVGIKPTYGLCSRYGIFSYSSSLDQAGIFSNNVIDNALLLEIIAGYDNKDSTMLKKDIKYDFTSNIERFNKDILIGVIEEYENININDEVKIEYEKVINSIKSLGINIKYLSFPRAQDVLPVYYIISPVEAMSNFSRYDGIRYGEREISASLLDTYNNSRGSGFGEEVKSRILMGTYNVLQENFEIYIKACQIRRLIVEDFKKMLSEVNFILTPTTFTVAFDLNHNKLLPLEMYYNDFFTVGVNLAGLPAISLPCGLSNNHLPVGMQLIGRYYEEHNLYNIAYRLEQEFNFNQFK